MRGWLLLLLCAVSAVLTAFVPAGLLVAPALWAFAAVRTKPHWIILPATVFAVAMFALDNAVSAAGLTGAAVLAAVLLSVLMTRGAGNADTALLLAGVFLAGLYAALCLPGVLDGRGAFADIQSAMATAGDLYRAALAQTPQISQEMAATATEMIDALYEAVPSGFVAVLCVFASVLGLGNLLLFRLFCRRHAEISISPIRPFREWTLPRSLTLGLFTMLIGSLILELAEWEYAVSFAVTVNVLVALPLLLLGLCVVDFFIVRSQKNIALKRALTYTGIGILLRLALYPLVLIGCFDLIFRLRERMRGMPPRAAI